MKRQAQVALAIVAVLTIATPLRTRAGECAEGWDKYIADLLAAPGSPGHEYALYCLGDNPIIMTRQWAGPNAGRRFAEQRTAPLRPRLARALSALLSSEWADSEESRHRVYRIAARYGITHLDSIDIYSALIRPATPAYFGVYEDLAILQDCRAVAFCRERYGVLRARPEAGYADEALDLLSCLYHVPCPDAVVAAKQLLLHERDPKLRERIQRVVSRRQDRQ